MRSRSGDLLRRLLDGGEIDAPAIRCELCLGETDFDHLVAGTHVMSLPHQLAFAALLIERVPRLARAGKTLRGQVLAAMAYTSAATSVHASQPLKWSRLKSLRA